MDKEVTKEFEQRDKILEGMRGEIDSLIGSLGDFKSETQETIRGLKEDQSSLKDSNATSELHDQAIEENARLHERVSFLESQQYETEIVQNFLRSIDADNFHAIGIKLGYLEDTATEEDLENLEGAGPVEVPLGDNQTVVISRDVPDDPDNWEYSQSQGVYVKVKEA